MKGPRNVRIHRRAHTRRCFRSRPAEVTLQVPKLRTLPFETALIERYRRKEASVGKALVEMYLAGVSVRWVEDITEALWGTQISPSTVSEPEQGDIRMHRRLTERSDRRKTSLHILDGLWLKRSWRKHLYTGRHRSEPGWIPPDPRRGGRIEGRQRELGKLPEVSKGKKALGDKTFRYRQEPGAS